MKGHVKKRGDRYDAVIYEGRDPVTGSPPSHRSACQHGRRRHRHGPVQRQRRGHATRRRPRAPRKCHGDFQHGVPRQPRPRRPYLRRDRRTTRHPTRVRHRRRRPHGWTRRPHRAIHHRTHSNPTATPHIAKPKRTWPPTPCPGLSPPPGRSGHSPPPNTGPSHHLCHLTQRPAAMRHSATRISETE